MATIHLGFATFPARLADAPVEEPKPSQPMEEKPVSAVTLNNVAELNEFMRTGNFAMPPPPVHLNLFSQKLNVDAVSALGDTLRLMSNLTSLDLGRFVLLVRIVVAYFV
jgi:hypothetical protein